MSERNCPTCKRLLIYKNKRKFTIAIKKNSECGSCCKKGTKNPAFGKPGSKLKRPTTAGDNNPAKRPDVRAKISIALKGKPNGRLGKHHSIETRKKMRLAQLGDKSHLWKGGISVINYSERRLYFDTIEYKEWRKNVFIRDNYTCVLCSVRGGCLHAHHIKEYANYKELRISLNNGVTLCKKCHKEFHRKYGLKNLPDIFDFVRLSNS